MAAEPLELALLQHAQQLHLGGELDVADLVEKQRAAFGELEAPLLARVGAGERPLLVAEELRLDQRVRQRAAADLDERLLRARRVVVDGVRDQLLAGAGFAAQQHRRARPRHLGDLLVDPLHRAAVADDAGKVVALLQLLPEVRVFIDQPLVLGRDQPLHFQRLPDHRGGHAEERFRPIEVAVRLEFQVDAERADDAAIEADGHTDEARFLLVRLVARAGAEHQRGLFRDARHNHSPARFDHFADDPSPSVY